MGPVTTILAILAVLGVGYLLVRLSDTYRRMKDQRENAEWYSRQRYDETQDWTK